MTTLLSGLEGYVCQIDVLVHGRTQKEHSECLTQVLKWLGLTLNEEKCQFFQTEVKFLCHIIKGSGV